MDITILLPGAPSQRPHHYIKTAELQLGHEVHCTDLESLVASGLTRNVACIIAGLKTDVTLQESACRLWPEARFLHHLGDDRWSTERSSQVAADESKAAKSNGVAPQTEPQQPKRSAINAADANKEAGTIAYNIYLRHAWGASQNKAEIQRLMLQAEELSKDVSNLDQRIRKAIRDGETAYELGNELVKRLREQGADSVEFKQWYEATKADCPSRVATHLHKLLGKQREHLQQQRAKTQHNATYTISTPPLIVSAEGHPNAITNLNPSPSWTVLVDETGKAFDNEVEELNLNHKDVGKVVALAIPQGVGLAPLGAGFHAVNESNARIERILSDLTAQPVGIFGFSSKDPVAGRFSWLQQIDQLVRWVLRLLPMKQGVPTRVKFSIENRGGYNSRVDWKIRTETLLAELHQLDPKRYAQLSLSIEFIDKNSEPLNGYVDTLANCWGSPQKDKKKLLRHFALPGHCLLLPSGEHVYERLLLTLEGGQALRPSDWYALLQAAVDEEGQAFTLLHNCLQQLGDTVKQQPKLWEGYLQEVQAQLRLKSYSLAGLQSTLDWLETHKPDGETLPPLLSLRQQGARLALQNHRGFCDMALVASAFETANQLIDEDAPQACEIILRSVVAATNAFDFNSMEGFIQQWLTLPVASVGLLNHAKLLSTQGQLHAFRGEYTAADECFVKAITTFERLSDPLQASREVQQTTAYRLFAMLSSPETAFEVFNTLLESYLTAMLHCSIDQLPGKLARSGSNLRFAHQLYLRALLTYPDEMADQCVFYLDTRLDWQQGEDHPWPLILAYRAWLLSDAGQRNQASELLQQAVELCEQQSGSILQWLGCVIQALGEQLQLSMPYLEPLNPKREALRTLLPAAPHAELDRALQIQDHSRSALINMLNQTLPFNFH